MTESSHRPVGFGGAFVRQFKLLWTSRRPVLLMVGLVAILVLSGDPWMPDPKARLFTFWPLWLIVVGPAWAFVVFHNEGPSKRLYHWSLPVGRMQHTLARLAAGVAWLWIVYGLLIGVGALLAAMDGDIYQFQTVDALGWLNFFTGPLIGYLAASVLTVASDYPIRWFFGITFAFPLTLSVLDEWLGLTDVVQTLLKPLSSETWGVFPVMIGGLATPVARLENQLHAAADPNFTASGEWVMEHWWLYTSLWVLLFAVIVAVVASRHPDTLPRLRRSG